MLEAFKKEFFRPVVTLIFPSCVMLWPYLLILTQRYPNITMVLAQKITAVLLVTGVLFAGIGLLLEDLGGLVEAYIIEPFVFRDPVDRTAHNEAFRSFLRKEYTTEPIGMRFIDSMTVRMKFELGVAVALPLSLPGIIWLYTSTYFCTIWQLITGVFLAILLVVYLLWEAKCSFWLRSRYRSILVLESENKSCLQNKSVVTTEAKKKKFQQQGSCT